MSEEWRVIAGHPNYMVSSDGRVKSLARTVRIGKFAKRTVPETLLRPTKKRDIGYLAVMLDRRQYLVQCLVLEAFVSPRPPDAQCAHYDGSRQNNRLENLRWATCKDNLADRIRHGTAPRGARNNAAKLTASDVLRIRRDTRPRVVVAREYGVTPEAIGAVVLRKNWGWLPDQECAEHCIA